MKHYIQRPHRLAHGSSIRSERWHAYEESTDMMYRQHQFIISQASWHRQSEQGEGVHTFKPLQTLEQPHTDGEKTQVISQEFF